MRISMSWLKEYVDVPWGPKELADRLTQSGSMVEAVHSLGDNLRDVIIGRIKKVDPHPSDRRQLTVCTVDIGHGEVQTVTGAPNARVGLLVPVALPGVVLPASDRPVAEAQVGGVTSGAVLCSERELGLSDDHTGLMEIPGEVTVGSSIVDALGLDDTILELEIYPNRPDCLSVIGIAREVAALTGGELRLPIDKADESDQTRVRDRIDVQVDAPDLCTRYLARVITGVTIGPSPEWMQRRLRAAGMRPINNVVDVTNYCLMEFGQPLHAFDHEHLSGRRIIVRKANPQEEITTLDGETHKLSNDMLLICDADRPVALAGIMGGLDSEVRQSTTTIVLESARFDPVSVRKTSKQLGIRTESSYRFERDIDPNLSAWVVERAAQLIAELGGGQVAKGRIDVCEPLPPPIVVSCSPKRINERLGTKLSPAEMKRILRGLGFGVEISKDASVIEVTVPSYRRDVSMEADVIEEIARIYGYDHIPATLPEGANLKGGLADPLPGVDLVRRTLVTSGCFESITYSFVSPKLIDRMAVADDHPWRATISLANPISEEHSVMRTTLLPSLLDSMATNVRRRVDDVRLFEIGMVYLADSLPLTTLPKERRTLTIVQTGAAVTDVWGAPSRPIDFYDLKGTVEAVGEALRLDFRIGRGSHPAFHPGRTAECVVQGHQVGILGEIHPSVAQAFGLRGRVYAAELDLETLLSLAPAPIEYAPIPRFPAIERDLALLVPSYVDAARVVELIMENAGPTLSDVQLFDVYEGDQIPSGYRSLAYAITYRADDRTLTDEEVSQAQTKIEQALEADLGVRVRR